MAAETYTEMVKGESICIRNANDEPFMGCDDHPYEIHVTRNGDESYSVSSVDLITGEYGIMSESDIRDYMMEVRMIMAKWDEEGN